MTNTSKIALAAVVASIIGLSAQASPITGSISFGGSVLAAVNADGSGGAASSYATAQSLVFQTANVGAGQHNGSFASIPDFTSVVMFSPLEINPPGALALPAGALWQVGGFTFTLTDLSEDPGVGNTLTLRGDGDISAAGFDTTSGTFVATFTTADGGSGVTFAWGSSSAANAPDAGSSLLLLGLGLSALIGYSQFRKQVA